jgi:serine/threonine protein kinase
VADPDGTRLIGRRLGIYQVQALLGTGGMGEVYRAHDSKLGRDVALKVLPRELADQPERRARLLLEARAAAALNHPNICTIHEVGEADGHAYIAMEVIEGQPLNRRLAEGPLPPDEVLRYGLQLAEALAHAHERGVVHRDLKSANVMVTPEGRVKVLDFGLAKRLNGEELADVTTRSHATLTQPGAILGTLPYMAPEQLRGQPADVRSDVWALGVVLYEMAAGARPFAGHTGFELSSAIFHETPPPLPSRVPAPLQAVTARCLEKEPARRYQRASEVRAALETIESHTNARVVAPPLPVPSSRWPIAAAGLALVIVLAASLLWLRSSSKPAARSEWTQLTNFPDSVSQPTLSPDGRMLTFIRGPRSFTTSGQIYVKILPDGEPKQLTRDNLKKMSPVFSPDGSRIAYTTEDAQNEWDTWVVPVLGGEPRRWLPNASGLVWVAKQKLLFSEKIRGSEGNHMKIVAADESRAGARDLYVPMPKGAMAHRSYPSPDGNWVLVAEMDDRGVWTPCRLIPMDGSSRGRQMGPPGAACWFAAWSPDGKWMYLNSSAGGAFHTWRQRFPEREVLAEPEQITSGPTEEEGIAMAPDGRSFITAVGLKQGSVWVRDSKGDRQISLEGYAHHPKFTPDGKRLLYAVLTSAAPQRSELWVVELDSGLNEPLLPGFPIGIGGAASFRAPYDISPDGRQAVVEAIDRDGKHSLWLAPLDRRSPPRQIPNVEGDGPLFGAGGEILFRARERDYGFAYRVREDGTGLRKASEHPVIETTDVSPDGQWLVVYARPSKEEAGATLALPLGGGPPVQIYGQGIRMKWSPDGRLLFLMVTANTYVLPLPPGRALPEIPAGGFRSEAEIAGLPGVRVIDSLDVAPGSTPDVYAFSRETVQRNLYRIPVP